MIYYILQPFHEQAIAIAKFIKENPKNRLIAVLLDTEKYKNHTVYDEITVVEDYSKIPPKGFIVPTGAKSTEIMLSRGDMQLNDIKMIQKNLLVFDKIAFLNLCRKNNLPIPNQFEYWELKDLSFPIFFKEKNEKGGGLRGRANSFDDLIQVPLEDLIFQELIESPGTYGVAFLAKEGKMISSFSHYEMESYPVSGGSATVIQAIHDSRLIELTEKFITTFGYEGWGLAEYKYCPTRKDYVFMEVNAKFWASCYFSFKNNPDFLKKLFSTEVKTERIETLIFINRLLNTGLLNTIKVLCKYRGVALLKESSLIKSFLKGFLFDIGLRKK
ncbi:hypothetical protein [Acinetobacter indicus]|uniref:hypothetical protein n=1 Tax=Acinetobacter indicus TaxID=756892 RepID=UPI0014449C4D|nr:hypothetical protein [Acinetobacter indicus]